MRVVVDTNVVVSRYLAPQGRAALVLERWQQEKFYLLVSEPILREYERVLKYDRLRSRHGLSDEEIAELIEDFREFAVLVIVGPEATLGVVKQDREDNKFLECAAVGGAECLVSGDEHLLALEQYQGSQILSPAAFLAVLDNPEGL